jgi:hypothetical protein
MAFLDQVVAEAYSAGLHADTDLAGGALGDFALMEFKISAGFRNDSDFIFGTSTFLVLIVV